MKIARTYSLNRSTAVLCVRACDVIYLDKFIKKCKKITFLNLFIWVKRVAREAIPVKKHG